MLMFFLYVGCCSQVLIANPTSTHAPLALRASNAWLQVGKETRRNIYLFEA